MMPRQLSSQLLLVPSGLLAGHAISSSVLQAPGHGEVWSAGSIEGLACVSIPLALAVLVRAALAGLRDEPSPILFAPLAALQVAVFLAVEITEHAGSSARPSVLLTVAVGVAAQVAAAALLCLLASGVATLGRRARTRTVRRQTDTRVAAQGREMGLGWSTLLLLPRLQRGPPLGLG